MAAPTVYTWLDPGAPSLTRNSATSYKALFQACLIDGYGSKTPPGSGTNKWSIPFSSSSAFILKQGGTKTRKTCLKISSITTNYGNCEAADDYTDINTPVNKWTPTQSYVRLPMGYSINNSYTVPWVIIATERSIYAFFGYNSTSETIATLDSNNASAVHLYHWFFGDYVPEDPSITVNQLLTFYGHSSSTSNYYCQNFMFNNALFSDRGAKTLAGSFSNLSTPMACEYLVSRPISQGATVAGAPSTHTHVPYYPNGVNGGLYLDKLRIISHHQIMGEMPGLLYPVQAGAFATYGSLMSIDGTGDYSGEKLHVFNDYNESTFMVRDGEWGVE